MNIFTLDEFTLAYLEAALWATPDDSGKGEFLDQNYGFEDIADETLAEMVKDCQEFQAAHWVDICGNLTRAGHDFFLTRESHGSGFWDGDWPEDIGERLTKASQVRGGYNLYVGDDGRIYS